MEEKKYTDKIEELLYEESARRMLRKSSDSSTTTRSLIVKMVAAAATILIFFLSYQYVNSYKNNYSNSLSFAKENYQFPIVNKSRGIENQTDRYIQDLKDGKYQTVLAGLKNKALSEQDVYIKAHLLYNLDSLEASKQIIKNQTWKDSFYNEEMKWLEFLIAIKENKSHATLATLSNELPNQYRQKANEFLKIKN